MVSLDETHANHLTKRLIDMAKTPGYCKGDARKPVQDFVDNMQGNDCEPLLNSVRDKISAARMAADNAKDETLKNNLDDVDHQIVHVLNSRE